MKTPFLIVLLALSVLLIFLSQETFYSGPTRTHYLYDGDYKVGAIKYDKNDKKLEEITFNTYIRDKKWVHEDEIVHFTFWGKARGPAFVIAIISTVIVLLILVLSNKDKIANFMARKSQS